MIVRDRSATQMWAAKTILHWQVTNTERFIVNKNESSCQIEYRAINFLIVQRAFELRHLLGRFDSDAVSLRSFIIRITMGTKRHRCQTKKLPIDLHFALPIAR